MDADFLRKDTPQLDAAASWMPPSGELRDSTTHVALDAALPAPSTIHKNGFDYRDVEEEVVAFARETANTVRRLHAQQTSSILRAGQKLIEVKQRLPHKQYLPWVEAEFGGKAIRTIQRYMQAAKVFGGKYDMVSYLLPTTVYKLAERGTPKNIREEVIEKLTCGERLSDDAILDMIQKRKDADRHSNVRKARSDRSTSDSNPPPHASKEHEDDHIEAQPTQRNDECTRAAEEAITLLDHHLGPDLDAFASLYKTAGPAFAPALAAHVKSGSGAARHSLERHIVEVYPNRCGAEHLGA
jgi:hypothetical protein